MGNDKRPTEPFNEAAENYEMDVVFDSEIDLNDGDEQLRDNTDPKHDPKYEKNSGYSPMGTGLNLGASSSRSNRQTPSTSQSVDVPLSDDEWQDQLRNGNHTFEEDFNGLRVRTWQAEQPAEENIEGGHISEMVVTKGDYGREVRLAHFRNGDWEKRPEFTPERQAISLATHEYDGDFFKAKLEKEIADREQQQALERNRNNGQSR